MLGDRFWSKVDKSGECWVWLGSRNRGYGTFNLQSLGRRKIIVRAHRVAYEELVGPIPESLHLDHLCRNRACVNPAHLEPVTSQENARRGVATRTHCRHGHPYDEANTGMHHGRRDCRACHRDAERRRLARLRLPQSEAGQSAEAGSEP